MPIVPRFAREWSQSSDGRRMVHHTSRRCRRDDHVPGAPSRIGRPQGGQTGRGPVGTLLPSRDPVRFLDDDGTGVRCRPPATIPSRRRRRCSAQYRRMVIGRRFDAQCTALTKQGRLAVYPSVARARRPARSARCWPCGRPTGSSRPTATSMALFARGIDPVEALTLLRGDWHCGYDPPRGLHRAAVHAARHPDRARGRAGLRRGAAGARHRGAGVLGDGATSEGDFHEAVNFAAVFRAPVVFFVQNNRYAISVPLSRQTAAPSLAYKGIGYGVASEQVDGNDPVAVLAVLDQGGRARPRRQRAVPGRGAHLPDGAAHQRRRRHPLPRRGRGRRVARAATRSPGWRPTCATSARSTTPRSRPPGPRPRRAPPTCASG